MDNLVKLKNPKLINVVFWGILIALIFFTLQYFEKLFKPLFIAFFLWFLINEMKSMLSKIKISGKMLPHYIRIILAFLIIFLFLGFLFEFISLNVKQIASSAPDYESKFDELLNQIIGHISNPEILATLEKLIKEINITGFAGSFANSLTLVIGDSVLILIYLVFMILEETVFRKKINKIFPVKDEQYQRISEVVENISTSVKKYFISKTLVSVMLAVSCYIIMLFFGLDFPVLWAFLIFILNYIPYFGSFIATLLPSTLAIFQFGNINYFVYVFIAIQSMQTIMANVVEPKLMGNTLNLSPLIVLVSLALWGYMWGIVGMILAVPITAILIIILSHFPVSKNIAIALSLNGNIGEDKTKKE